MTFLAFKILFRKRATTSSILAIMLLPAILVSVNSTINHINSQAETLGSLMNIGETYLILSENSTSITDSKVNAELATHLNNIPDVKYTFSQKIFTATLTTSKGDQAILIRCIEDVSNFLKQRNAYVNGTIAKGDTEVNIGEILTRSASINVGDEADLATGNNVLTVKVVGTLRSQTARVLRAEIDAGLIAPMEVANRLTGNYGKISLIEFAIRDNINREEAINHITELLPKDVKVLKTQQLQKFMQEMNDQTLTFLNLWSLTVYAVVVAASYIIATRLTTESSYEFAMLKALGAKKRLLFTLILTYTATIVLLGSILGIALGMVGAQTASTMFRWIWPSVEITPFLEPIQALQTLLLTLISSTMGCIYPAFRSARTRYTEQPL